MDFATYQPLAQRTSSTWSYGRKVRNGVLGLIGEAGEVVDIAKKTMFQGKPMEEAKAKFVDEIGDVLWYCAELCEGLGVKLCSVVDTFRHVYEHGYPDPDLDSLMVQIPVEMVREAVEIHLEIYGSENKEPGKIGNYNGIMMTIYVIVHHCEALLYYVCGCSLEQCMDANIEKLKARYPDGFSAERSEHREN